MVSQLETHQSGQLISGSDFPDLATVSSPRLSGFDFLLFAISLLSLVNMVLLVLMVRSNSRSVILIVDGVVSLFFLGNFINRFWTSHNRRTYLAHEGGWLDLVAAIPVPGFRLARIGHVRRGMRNIRRYGLRTLLDRGGVEISTIYLVVAVILTLCVVEFGSLWILRPESTAESANITSASDAIWWSYVTITTVGYGDRFPVTNQGRVVAAITLTLGVGLFAVLTSYLSSSFISPKAQRRADRQRDEQQSSDITDLKAMVEKLNAENASADVRSLQMAIEQLHAEIAELRRDRPNQQLT